MGNIIYLFICALSLNFLFMMVGLFLSHLFKNLSLIDVFWSLGISLMAWILLISSSVGLLNTVVLFLVSLWGLRLSFFLLLTRILKNHKDSRYEKLLAKSKGSKNYYLFFQYCFQYLLQVLISLSFIPFVLAQGHDLSFLFYFGAFLAAVGIIGETKADFELLAFKKKRTGGILATGLWSYSRHPNYFFDWLFWVGVGLMGVMFPFGFLAFAGTFFMWVIFHYLTGPITERHSLDKHQAAFKNYQRKVAFMIPFIKTK